MGTYFAYARVSTPRQGEKGVSLNEQRAAIEKYAAIHGLEISRWFEEQQSASHTGRPTFLKMLALLRKGTAQGVIIHKIDRGVRNLADWADVGKLVDAGVQIHFANENVDLKTVAGRLSADIQAVVAAHYSRNLREEVKKGMYGRLKQGFFPLRAPLGFLDQGSAKPKIHDPVRAPLVKKAFLLYQSGEYSIPALAEALFKLGLRSLNGGHVSVNGVATMLRNPFYVGLMRLRKTGEVYPGNHEPLISTELFEDVQEALDGKRVDRIAIQPHLFSRLARCISCGYSLIAERQKRHVYYRCHDRAFKKPTKCPSTCIREDRLEHAVISRLAALDLSPEELALANVFLAGLQNDAKERRVAMESSLRLQADQLQTRIGKLTDLLIDGTVEKATFEEKRTALMLEQTRVREQLTELNRGTSLMESKFTNTVELAKSASSLYKRADATEKRRLLKILLSNLSVGEQNVSVTLAPEFQLVAERKTVTEGRPDRGSCRTWEQTLKQLWKQFHSKIAAN
jgi:DNA invertase Pin-like site-specific DNA recombinase